MQTPSRGNPCMRGTSSFSTFPPRGNPLNRMIMSFCNLLGLLVEPSWGALWGPLGSLSQA
eukprot:4188870-Pyramimonas_sp.AAC.1